MGAIPPCGSGMRGAHCKQAAFRPADNSPSRRHFYTRAPTLPVNTVYSASWKIASAPFEMRRQKENIICKEKHLHFALQMV